MRSENLRLQNPFRDSPESLRKEAENDSLRRHFQAEEAEESRYAHLSIEQLRRRAVAQEHQQEARARYEVREHEIRRFYGDHPEYCENPANASAIKKVLQQMLAARGCEWNESDPSWTPTEFRMAADFCAQECLLELRGQWHRDTPTVKQLSELTSTELAELIRFGPDNERRLVNE